MAVGTARKKGCKMKSTKRHFTLETGEYFITPEHPDAKHCEVYLHGENITESVVGVIITNRGKKNERKNKIN